jgi:hypothetical protein
VLQYVFDITWPVIRIHDRLVDLLMLMSDDYNPMGVKVSSLKNVILFAEFVLRLVWATASIAILWLCNHSLNTSASSTAKLFSHIE